MTVVLKHLHVLEASVAQKAKTQALMKRCPLQLNEENAEGGEDHEDYKGQAEKGDVAWEEELAEEHVDVVAREVEGEEGNQVHPVQRMGQLQL